MAARRPTHLVALAILVNLTVTCPLLAAAPDFTGLGFGLGVTLTQDFGEHDRVEDAEIVNGIVRVTKERNSIVRLMLETHYFFPTEEKTFFASLIPGGGVGAPFSRCRAGTMRSSRRWGLG